MAEKMGYFFGKWSKKNGEIVKKVIFGKTTNRIYFYICNRNNRSTGAGRNSGLVRSAIPAGEAVIGRNSG